MKIPISAFCFLRFSFCFLLFLAFQLFSFSAFSQATLVTFPLNSLFGGAAYNKPITITAANTLISDGQNLWAGTYTIIPASTTNPVVGLYPNTYLMTVQGVATPVRFSVPASTNVLDVTTLLVSGPLFYFGTNSPFLNLTAGTNITFSSNGPTITISGAGATLPAGVVTNGQAGVTLSGTLNGNATTATTAQSVPLSGIPHGVVTNTVCIWIGGKSSDATNPTNWMNMHVPGPADTAWISANIYTNEITGNLNAHLTIVTDNARCGASFRNAIFYGNSINDGQCQDTNDVVQFRESSQNAAVFYGVVEFWDAALSSESCGWHVSFHNSSQGDYVYGDGYFYDSVQWQGNVYGDAHFYDHSSFNGALQYIQGNAYFFDASTNISGIVQGSTFYFNSTNYPAASIQGTLPASTLPGALGALSVTNGGGLTNLSAANFSTGKTSPSNNWAGTFTGSHTGSGAGLTNLPAAALTGLIYSNITGSATSSVPVVGGVIVDDDRGLVVTNDNRVVTLTNSGNTFAGNGAGLIIPPEVNIDLADFAAVSTIPGWTHTKAVQLNNGAYSASIPWFDFAAYGDTNYECDIAFFTTNVFTFARSGTATCLHLTMPSGELNIGANNSWNVTTLSSNMQSMTILFSIGAVTNSAMVSASLDLRMLQEGSVPPNTNIFITAVRFKTR